MNLEFKIIILYINNKNPSKISLSISSALNCIFRWFLNQDLIITICIYFLFHYLDFITRNNHKIKTIVVCS